jgi:plasmid stability protein
MKESTLTIRVENELKEKIALRAKRERRSLADETAYLMEIGLRVMERHPDPVCAAESPSVLAQTAAVGT